MITPVSPTFLKQEAKKLKKSQLLSMSEALDETARKFGFSNYRHYLNLSEENLKQTEYDKEVILKKISSENDKHKKIDLAISSIIKFKNSFSDQLAILHLFQHSDDFDDSHNSYDSAAQAVCEKLKLSEDLRSPDYGVQPCLQFVCEKLNLMKNEIQAYFLEDVNADEDRWCLNDIHPDIINIEDFIAKKALVHNLIYGINKDTLSIEGDYKIIFKLYGDKLIPENEDDPHYEYFKNEYHKDREMSGSFGVEIDINKKITIVHSDM